MPALLEVSDVSSNVRLGDIETLLLPFCTRGRIMSVGRQSSWESALVSFEDEQDAIACLGEIQMGYTTVTVSEYNPDAMVEVNSGSKRKSMAESKREKERRMNRVGLSYRCGKCGAPKKGHVCMLGGSDDEGGEEGEEGDRSPRGSPFPEDSPEIIVAAEEDIDGDALFKDVKAVLASAELATPRNIRKLSHSDSVVGGGPEAGTRGRGVRKSIGASGGGASGGVASGCGASGGGSSGGAPVGITTRKGAISAASAKAAAFEGATASGGAKTGSGGGSKSGSKSGSGAGRSRKASKRDQMPPPLPPVGKDALLNELDIAMQRPPSLITPEDAEGARPPGSGLGSFGLSSHGLGSIGLGSDFGVSPGALMSQLLGTPTPHVPQPQPPILSPGSLNDLGKLLQSPSISLPSAKGHATRAS